MTDIREQILRKIFDKDEHRMLDYPQVISKTGILDAMDEYAIKILQHAHSDFYFSEVTDIKKYLEETKLKLIQ